MEETWWEIKYVPKEELKKMQKEPISYEELQVLIKRIKEKENKNGIKYI